MSPRIFGKGRKPHPRQPRAADGAALVDYLIDGVGVAHLDAFYDRIGYPDEASEGMLAHVGGLLDGEDIVFISVWRSDNEAMIAWRDRREDVEAVLADARPDAVVTRRSSDLYRFYLGDDRALLEASLAGRGPACAGIVIDLPEVDIDSYDLVCDQMRFPDEWPDGLLLHFAGEVGDVLRVVSIWTTNGESRRFFEDRLIPASVDVAREHGRFPEIRPRELRVRLLALSDGLFE